MVAAASSDDILILAEHAVGFGDLDADEPRVVGRDEETLSLALILTFSPTDHRCEACHRAMMVTTYSRQRHTPDGSDAPTSFREAINMGPAMVVFDTRPDGATISARP